MFNLFYQGLVEDISNSNRGILIDGTSYNIFCYADDLLLASTAALGLQDLINIAVRYITQHGLRFNPEKSLCMIRGKNPLTDLPVWTIEETPLRIVDELSYLDTSIDNHSGTSHVEVRSRAAQRSYFSLQGAGLPYNGLSPETARAVFSLGVRSAMLYGCHSVMVKDVKLKLLDRLQSKLIKISLGIKQYTHSTPILRAMRIPPISKTVHANTIQLLYSPLYSDSRSGIFYKLMARKNNKLGSSETLYGRARTISNIYNFNLKICLLSDTYRSKVKRNILSHPGDDGLIDSVRFLLTNYCGKS